MSYCYFIISLKTLNSLSYRFKLKLKCLCSHLDIGGFDGRRPLILNGMTALGFFPFEPAVPVVCNEDETFLL